MDESQKQNVINEAEEIKNGQNIKKTQDQPLVPGVGVAGIVMCPYGFQRGACMKGGCELWVELTYVDQKVGRCAHSWNAVLSVENRQAIDRLVEAVKGLAK